MSRRLLSLLLLLTLSGCAFVTPRFEQNVQTEFAQQPMRKLTTRSVDLYYPERLRASALHIAARLEDCVERLRRLPVNDKPRGRALIYLTGENFNNAYVVPDSSSLPQQMVLPVHTTLELFNFMGFGPADMGAVGCHESVHYVQLQQTDGLWGLVNTITGGLFESNSMTESWFLEGLAVYYEGRLGQRVGRPHSPVWHGFFEATTQALGGELHPGYLSPEHRRMDPFGGNYLTGSHFVAWLAERYGEERLWRLVNVQGVTVIPPLALTLRFKDVYGSTLGTLFDQFSRELTATLQPRARPATQQVLAPRVGYFTRLAASPADGALATVEVGVEEVAQLVVRERDGAVRVRRPLAQFLPGRRWISTHPINMSGLSFTADGQSLFLVASDIDELGSDLSRVWQVDAHSGEVVQVWEGLQGMGGSVTPDGRAYVFVHVHDNTSDLERLELATGERTALTHFEDHTSLGPPAVAPDGRIVFPRRTEHGWNLALRETDGRVRALTEDEHFNYAPRWLEDGRVLFVREYQERWQAHVLDVTAGGEPVRLTDAPHLVMDVAAQGSEVVFLNREDFEFSLDRVPLAPAPAAPVVAAPADLPPPVPSQVPPEVAAPYQGHTLSIVSDEPYSPLEHFFLPELRAPYIYALPDTNSNRYIGYAGLALAGQDRLGLHQYSLLVQADTQHHVPTGSFSYATALTSPWYLQLNLARLATDDLRDLQASLSMSRTFWDTPVSLAVLALRRDWFSTSERPGVRTSLAGPQASISYFAGESTSYGGTQRGVGVSLDAGVYPLAFDSASPFADVRAEVDAVLPGLPLLRRDSLLVSAVARFLPNAPDGLLQVGGVPLGTFALQNREGPTSTRDLPLRLQSGSAFTENVRGYEDFALSARNVLVASARYRYHFVFDRGWASLLWLGPSFFISELNFEAFGSWARTDLSQNHRAAGAALFLNTTLGQALPFSIFYQYARRFDDGLGDLHLVGVSF